MSESLKREIEKLKKTIKQPSVKFSKEVKQLLKLVAKAQAKVSIIPTTWEKEYVTLLNEEWVTKLEGSDDSYLFGACLIILSCLKPDEKTLEETFQLAKKINPAAVQKWINDSEKTTPKRTNYTFK